MTEFPSKSKKSGKNPFSKPGADPLAGVKYADPPNVEQDAAAEFSAVLDAFKGRKKAEDQRFQEVTDSEFWFAVCFRTRADKEKFLRALKLAQLGDKYLDGHKAAQVLGIDL